MSLQVEILEESFAQVKPHADQFGASFYQNLFSAYPEARLYLRIPTWQHNKKS